MQKFFEKMVYIFFCYFSLLPLIFSFVGDNFKVGSAPLNQVIIKENYKPQELNSVTENITKISDDDTGGGADETFGSGNGFCRGDILAPTVINC